MSIQVANTDDWFWAISSGAGIGTSGAATEYMHTNPGLVLIPLVDAPLTTIDLAWIDPSHSDVHDFIKLCREVTSQEMLNH